MAEANRNPSEGGSINKQFTPAGGSTLIFDWRTRDGFDQIDAALKRVAAAGELCAEAAVAAGGADLVDWSLVHAALANAHNVIDIIRQSDERACFRAVVSI